MASAGVRAGWAWLEALLLASAHRPFDLFSGMAGSSPMQTPSPWQL